MTIGADRVRIKFNPNENAYVAELKAKSADLVTRCEELRNMGSEDKECQRLWDEAMTAYELAAMWAVKAATF